MFKPKFRTPHPSSKGLKLPGRFPVKVMVRHGASKKALDQKLRFPVEVNSIEAISNSANKSKMKDLLNEAKIKTIECFENTDENRQKFKDNKWNVVFKRRNHRRGIGMEFLPLDKIDQLGEVKYNGGLIERRINVAREWRVHCAPALDKFYPLEKRRKLNAEKSPVRNIQNCAFFEGFEKPVNWNEALELCKKAVTAIGLDVGAVDLAWSGKNFYIIEVNSGAGVGEKSRAWYADVYKQLVEIKVNKFLQK